VCTDCVICSAADGLPSYRRRQVAVRCAWWGFTTAADRQRIEGFLRRGVRAGYRRVDEPTAAQLVEDFDDQLFPPGPACQRPHSAADSSQSPLKLLCFARSAT